MGKLLGAIGGWFVSGWQQLVTGIAVAAIASAATFVMGINLGKDIILAGETKAAKQSLEVFRGEVDTMIVKATDDAFSDFDDKLKTLDTTTQTLRQLGERQNENSQALASALHGRFVLSADERLRFECIRRPFDARCAATPGASVRSAVP